MKFVFNYPETSGLESDLLDSGEISDVAVAVEAAGFDAFALTEHPIPGANWLAHGGHQTLDPFVGLAFAAAVTERIRLLTHLSVAPYRNPFLLAKTAATLDRCRTGRFILGLGTGYHKTEFFALGVDFDERNALFDEALELLPKAWSGEPFDAEGLHFTAKGVIQRPRPAQDPIPIWIGGNSKLSRRRRRDRAGLDADGHPRGGGAHHALAAHLGPRAAGRDDRRGEGHGRRPRRRARLLHELHGGGHPPAHERHPAPRRRAREMEAAGITCVNVGHPPTTPQQMLDFIQAFGETYISTNPFLRQVGEQFAALTRSWRQPLVRMAPAAKGPTALVHTATSAPST